MVLDTFGGGVDLHTGGADLAFPHHACEAMLAEAAVGVRPFARAWLRAGTVALDGAKMAKSSGNLVLVDDLLKTHSPAAVRLLCLNRRWADGWNFTIAELDAAAGILDSLYAAAARTGRGGPGGADADEVQRALLADLDVPRAIDVALATGGAGARHLLDVLALG
jgi:cysteinyl-tRNA synthetase